jgi:hypothetical protein
MALDGQGVIVNEGGSIEQAVGRVASPMRQESTTSRFYFWVRRGKIVEKTQLVRAASLVGELQIRFYGIVDEVFRRSRKNSMGEEVDAFDGEIDYEPPFGSEGVTFAEVTLIRMQPNVLTPPLEQSLVWLADKEDAAFAYGYDQMLDEESGDDWGLAIGLVRNGAVATIGVAKVDLRDLCGERAGHLNVTGQSGHGTKSSFLLVVLRALLALARRNDDGRATGQPFSVRPIVFNVKGNDLMFIDQPNRLLTAERANEWAPLDIEATPFTGASFLSPCADPGNRGVPRVQRQVAPEAQARTYYWTLSDVIRYGLWSYLFSEETQQSESMMALADHLLGLLARDCTVDDEHPAGMCLREEPDIPVSFDALRDWLHDALRNKKHVIRDDVHTFGTCRALLSRLGLALGREGATIFDRGTGYGRPLNVLAAGTTDPLVIDVAGLPTELRRFVVAAVLDQVKEHQIGPERIPGQVYFLMLDELGIYAPRGARDPITRLCEHVTTQLRSQGIILLGGQQHASKISESVFGNSEVKVLGASTPVELETPTWSHLLTSAQKSRAMMLAPNEKMVQTSRGWMNVVVPFPAWAMKQSEIGLAVDPSANGRADGEMTSAFPLNLPVE